MSGASRLRVPSSGRSCYQDDFVRPSPRTVVQAIGGSMTRIGFAAALLLAALPASAQDLASFEKRVTLKTLPNGLTLIVLERPEAPVFSFFTHVDSGSDR